MTTDREKLEKELIDGVTKIHQEKVKEAEKPKEEPKKK